MVSFALPDIRRFVLDAIDIIYGDADDAQTMMASDFNIRPDTVRQWVHGRRSPPREMLVRLQQMLADQQQRASGFKKRLEAGLPNMVCPICGADFIIHHHQRGRTIQCRANTDHIFEPEEGPPFGNDTPKKFVQVPGGLAAIEQRDFTADCSQLIEGETLRFPGRIPPVGREFIIAVGDVREQALKRAWMIQRSDQLIGIRVDNTTWALTPTYEGQERSWTIAGKI